jgi:hypothetical protein
MRHHLPAFLHRFRFTHTYAWALLFSCLVVALAATLARATLNLAGALGNKPDLAVLLLLPEEDISHATHLRTKGDEREYLVMTKEGPKLVKLHKGKEQWFVREVVELRP